MTMDAMRSEVERFISERTVDANQQIGGERALHDIVAHIALGDRLASRRITGAPPPSEGAEVASREPWDLDAFNDEPRSRMASRPMTEVMAKFDVAWQLVRRAVTDADDDACRPGGRVWTIVDDESAGLCAQHIPIRELPAERSGA